MNQHPNPPPEDDAPPEDELQKAALGRRRLIRLGAGVVPASLMLASRPVRAWHCNTTSAWGSTQVSPSASANARYTNEANGYRVDETWTVANWKNNTTRAGLTYPWVALGTQTSTSGVSSFSKSRTLAWLFGSSGPFPAGLSGTQLVWDRICNGTQFQKYMIVAKLNKKLLTPVAQCLTSQTGDQLTAMLDGVYQPPNLPGTVWVQADIINYLQKNWIVVDA